MATDGEKLVVLSGGTGSAKFVRGLQGLAEFTIVVNVGDNAWFHGLYVCPDIDIVTYTLAGIADATRGWGIQGDKFDALQQLKKLGADDTWFNLGDLDLATHLLRTALMRKGERLTVVTSKIAKRLGVRGVEILPVTDQHVETHILTSKKGEMHLQEFWVREKGKPEVKEIRYIAAESAQPSREVAQRIASAERIIIAPANPLTSIIPILSVAGFRDMLARSKARRVAVSPMIGGGAYSGPAGGLMASRGIEPTSEGVARLYKGLIDAIVIDENDGTQGRAIEDMGVSCVKTSTLMKTRKDETRLARVAMKA